MITGDYFLLIIGAVWATFASIEDIKYTEVANWLTFSLLGFAMAFRFGESWLSGNWNYLFFGAVGMGIYFLIANMFYYTKVFAGGDAKLLWGIGAILPYNSWESVWILLSGFLILFMVVGVAYTGIFSVFLIRRNFLGFKRELYANLRKYYWAFAISLLVAILAGVIGEMRGMEAGYIIAGLVFLLPLIYCYLKAVEKACLISYVNAGGLREGDWLDKAINVRGRWIGKSVHGLSKNDILLLRKSGKSVWLKQGIPFIPVFLISLLIMLYAFSTGLLSDLKFDWIASLFLGS